MARGTARVRSSVSRSVAVVGLDMVGDSAGREWNRWVPVAGVVDGQGTGRQRASLGVCLGWSGIRG